MENLQVVNAICDALENITQSVRTRKTGEKSKTKSDVFKYANESGELFYKHEQITAEHRFDCDTLREAPNAIDLIASGLVSDMVIDSQKNGRALSVDAFTKQYNNAEGVTVNAFDALTTNVKEVKPETVRKLQNKLSREQQIVLINEQQQALGLEMVDGKLVPKQ